MLSANLLTPPYRAARSNSAGLYCVLSISWFSQTSGSPSRSMYFSMASSLLMPFSLAHQSHLARASTLIIHGWGPCTSPLVACRDKQEHLRRSRARCCISQPRSFHLYTELIWDSLLNQSCPLYISQRERDPITTIRVPVQPLCIGTWEGWVPIMYQLRLPLSACLLEETVERQLLLVSRVHLGAIPDQPHGLLEALLKALRHTFAIIMDSLRQCCTCCVAADDQWKRPAQCQLVMGGNSRRGGLVTVYCWTGRLPKNPLCRGGRAAYLPAVTGFAKGAETHPSHACRQSLRQADGHLSPAAFSPVSRERAAEATKAQEAAGAAALPLLQLNAEQHVFCRLWEQQIPEGMRSFFYFTPGISKRPGHAKQVPVPGSSLVGR